MRFTLEFKSAVSAFANTLGTYKIKADGTIDNVHILFDNTLNVAAGHAPSISACRATASVSASS